MHCTLCVAVVPSPPSPPSHTHTSVPAVVEELLWQLLGPAPCVGGRAPGGGGAAPCARGGGGGGGGGAAPSCGGATVAVGAPLGSGGTMVVVELLDLEQHHLDRERK